VQVLIEKTLNAAGCKCKAVIYQAKGAPIIFLHGLSYTSDIWTHIGATELLKSKHVPFLALDMPYGMHSDCQPKTRNEEASIALVKEAAKTYFEGQVPILVGASIGGHMALAYAAKYPVKGLLLIAPARSSEETLTKAYGSFRFPVRIIWGSEDNIISGEDMRNLSEELPNAKLVTYEGAGHSAYKNEPERFRRDLLELYAQAELQ
jgi:pimeloyl-ACP methyl ester carboxylesterase